MKVIKKAFVILLIVSLIAVELSVRASALIIRDGDFGYEVNASKHEATLVSYKGGGKVELPEYYLDYPVKKIARNAFSGNTDITEIVFSSANTTVEEYAFMGCTSLETVYIPENVVSFGDRAFANCTSLTTVTVLSDIVSVPSNMFLNCSSLENVTLNDKIADFGYGCFSGCSSLTDLSFVSNGVMLGSYAFNGTGAESVVLSDSLFAIPDFAFTNCPNLRYVTIPESVSLIQPNAFDLENLTIRCYPDSYALSFAEANGTNYELLCDVLLGDSDGDGRVNIADVTAIQRHIAELETLSGASGLAADIIPDGNIDISDATMLQMYLAGYEVEYKVEETATFVIS